MSRGIGNRKVDLFSSGDDPLKRAASLQVTTQREVAGNVFSTLLYSRKGHGCFSVR